MPQLQNDYGAFSDDGREYVIARADTPMPWINVISNGVINLSPDKAAVFAAAARALRPGGRLAIADIVTAVQLPEGVTCDASLWAACIGGAMRRDRYEEAISSAGFEITEVRENDQYRFISDRADNATRKYGVTSISLLARRPE